MSKPWVNSIISRRTQQRRLRPAVIEQLSGLDALWFRAVWEALGGTGPLSFRSCLYPELLCCGPSPSYISSTPLLAMYLADLDQDTDLQSPGFTSDLHHQWEFAWQSWASYLILVMVLRCSCLGALLLCPCQWGHCSVCFAVTLGSQFAIPCEAESCWCSLMLISVLYYNNFRFWMVDSHTIAYCMHTHSN